MQLASRLARSRGSKLQEVRIWRTIEGFAAKGNSPGVESPKQCRCARWNVCCNGDTRERDESTIVWNVTEELLPLAAASIRHCLILSSQTWSSGVISNKSLYLKHHLECTTSRYWQTGSGSKDQEQSFTLLLGYFKNHKSDLLTPILKLVKCSHILVTKHTNIWKTWMKKKQREVGQYLSHITNNFHGEPSKLRRGNKP